MIRILSVTLLAGILFSATDNLVAQSLKPCTIVEQLETKDEEDPDRHRDHQGLVSFESSTNELKIIVYPVGYEELMDDEDACWVIRLQLPQDIMNSSNIFWSCSGQLFRNGELTKVGAKVSRQNVPGLNGTNQTLLSLHIVNASSQFEGDLRTRKLNWMITEAVLNRN